MTERAGFERDDVVIGLLSGEYERRVILPVALIIAAATVMLLALVVWTAGEHNQIARDGELRQLRLALEAERRRVEERLFDHARWDEAYDRAHLGRDADWVQGNLLAGAEDGPGLALTAVIDPEGEPWFVARHHTRVTLDLGAALDPGSLALIRQLREAGDDPTAVRFGLLEGRLAIIAAAPISPHTPGRTRMPGPRSVLLQVEALAPAHLRWIAESYGLAGLQLRLASESAAAGEPRLVREPLRAADGTAIGELVWRPKRPGDVLLGRFVPVLALGLASLTLFVWVVVRNVRRSAQALRTSEALALRDPLTGLANRRLFGDLLSRELARSIREGHLVAVHCLDLDGFKPINDRFGHAVGDAVLREVAARLAALVRAADCVARLGGDEFAILQVGIADRGDAVQLAARAAAALAEPLVLPAGDVGLGVSIGIAFGPDQARGPGELVHLADAAMYEAKRAGKGGWRLADPPPGTGAAIAPDPRPAPIPPAP